jgi:16S rRNA (cytosine1402-N4)-methyltransferase
MRFNRGDASRPSAGDIIRAAPEARLRQLLSAYGEEPHAGAVARAIVRARGEARGIGDTLSLARVVEGAAAAREGGAHAATRTFQALRCAVNDELGALARFLAAAPRRVAPGGLLAIISFHSLEDRIVKRAFAALAQGGGGGGAGAWLPPEAPIAPSPSEVAANPRARSAKLRVIRRAA